MTKYCLGFMFSKDGEKVALINKTHPNWQKGKLNGIGGHLNKNEEYLESMIREFEEETGVKTNINDWRQYCIMRSESLENKWICKVFCCFSDNVYDCITKTDEIVELVNSVEVWQRNAISNLKWLIPMAFDKEFSISNTIY